MPDDEQEHAPPDGDEAAEAEGEGAGEAAGVAAGEEPPDPTWFDFASQTTCPACGAAGAMMLGEGVFCPTCGEISTPRSRPS